MWKIVPSLRMLTPKQGISLSVSNTIDFSNHDNVNGPDSADSSDAPDPAQGMLTSVTAGFNPDDLQLQPVPTAFGMLPTNDIVPGPHFNSYREYAYSARRSKRITPTSSSAGWDSPPSWFSVLPRSAGVLRKSLRARRACIPGKRVSDFWWDYHIFRVSSPPAYSTCSRDEYLNGPPTVATLLPDEALPSRQVRIERNLNACLFCTIIYGAVLSFLSVVTIFTIWVSFIYFLLNLTEAFRLERLSSKCKSRSCCSCSLPLEGKYDSSLVGNDFII